MVFNVYRKQVLANNECSVFQQKTNVIRALGQRIIFIDILIQNVIDARRNCTFQFRMNGESIIVGTGKGGVGDGVFAGKQFLGDREAIGFGKRVTERPGIGRVFNRGFRRNPRSS
jgi:hypothetical protein